MPKKPPPKPNKKWFEFLEGDVIKMTGLILTVLVATQIVFVKGSHLVKEMKADVLGANEVSEEHASSAAGEEQENSATIKEPENSLSADFYKNIVESASNVILKWNANGVITYMNPFGAEFFGYTEDEIIGKSMFLLVPGVESGTKRDLNQMLRDIQKNPENFKNSENENIKKGGELVWMIWTNNVIRDNGENEILSIGNAGVRGTSTQE